MSTCRAGPTVAVGLLVAFALVACGGGDDLDASDPIVQSTADQNGVDISDPLVQAIADDVVADAGSPFEGKRASADCFAVGIVESIGKTRAGELGFSAESIPNELYLDWTADEVDVIIERFDDCVDVAALTRSFVASVMNEEDVDCVLGEIGDRFYLAVLRAELAAGADEEATQAAADAATEPLWAATVSCGGQDRDADGSEGPTDGSEPAEGDPDPSALPAAPAPLGLDGVRLPDDSDGVDVLFDALPTELLGGTRSIEVHGLGQLSVMYQSTTRTCAQSALQAGDLGEVREAL